MSTSGQLQRVADGAGSLLNYSDLVLRHTSGAQREQLLATVRQQMLDYARLHAELQQGAEALRETKDAAVLALSHNEPVDLAELVDDTRRRTEERMAAVGEEELSNYDRFQELLRRVEAAGGAGSVTGDQELVMTETHLVTRDPWSQQEIANPYRNSRCGHVYDRASLETVLQKRSRKPTCPYVGCANKVPLRWEDLTEDIVAKQAIEKRKRQTQPM